MSTLRLDDDAALPSLTSRDRIPLRRRRTTGPLRTLPQRRSGSWVVSFALFAASVVAVAVAVVGLSDRNAPTLTQPAHSPAQASSRVAAATVAPAPLGAPVAIVRREAVVASANPSAAAAQPIEPTRAASVPPAPNRPAAQASPFSLDRLPVLETDGAGFEADPDGASPVAAPPRPAARTGARRSAAAPQR